MPRTKIINSKSCKLSLDISDNNKDVLDNLTSNYKLKYGPMINKIIATFCRMPKPIKDVIEITCKNEYKRLTKQLENTKEEYFRKPLEQDIEACMEIYKLINNGASKIEDEKKMKKIQLADGYLIIPENWIVVNPESASDCRYAAVLECRNYTKYDVPHFIYLNNFKYGSDFTNSMEQDFYRKCAKEWDRFSEIQKLSEENQLVEDPNNKGNYLNVNEYLDAPIIGIFCIDEQNNNKTREMPYGAMIVRKSTVNE